MSTYSRFKKFCEEKLAINNRGVIARRGRAITKRLNKEFWQSESETNHSFYVGSFGRDTAIGCSDVDMIITLPRKIYSQYNSYQQNGQSALLQSVKNSLRTTLWKTSLKGDGQVVVVEFSDGMCFEVVPAFLTDNGQYCYPDSNSKGKWKYTNPKAEIQAISIVNNNCSGNLKALCRMIRAWKQKWKVPISGILIDTLAYNFIGNWKYRKKSYSHYDQMIRDFLLYLSKQKPKQEYWLAPGSKDRVGRKKGSFEPKAKKCYTLVEEAISLGVSEKKHLANKKWRQVFGNRFPTK
jgi:hypothetical protein